LFRSYKYRIYPNKQQNDDLDRVLEIHRQLYNAALTERCEAWKRCRVNISYYDQTNQLKAIREFDDDAAWLNFTSIQRTLRRLDKAFQFFFRCVKAGETSGYPRFKSKKRWKSAIYTFGDGIGISNGRLRIQNVGKIKVKWHRPLPPDGKPKSVVVKRTGEKWYAIFQVELPDPEPIIHTGPVIGIDLGLTSLVALSTGETVEAPRFFRETEAHLRRQQRRASRRKKFSNRWRKAQCQVSKTHSHIADQRRDFLHKLSRRLVDDYSLIAVEDLNINGLAKSRLSKSVHDAGWFMLLQMLAYKAEEAGSRLVSVDPYNTSQACSRCGCLVRKELSVRVHDCPHCGLVIDRDHNAAINVLSRALAAPGLGDQDSTWPVRACVS